MLINLKPCDGVNLKSGDFLTDYYQKNKDKLQQFETHHGSTVTLLSNFSGWCTLITPNLNIIQCWAGELSC